MLWGNREYVKRFVNTLSLGGGTGFEINPHLAQKGYGNEPGNWRIFKNKDNEYYEWEYERYWIFYKMFGQLSYNPDALISSLKFELEKKFGENVASDILHTYEAGSQIITFLVQYQLSDMNMYTWPEIDTGGSVWTFIWKHRQVINVL